MYYNLEPLAFLAGQYFQHDPTERKDWLAVGQHQVNECWHWSHVYLDQIQSNVP